MLMPTVFHENLFDDFFDPFWNDAALERAMNREARGAFGKRGANMMKTDVKQTDNGYEVAVDLPGCKKEDVQMELDDGYLTIQAPTNTPDDAGPYITLGMCYASHPDTGLHDVTIHRLCIQGKDELSIFLDQILHRRARD